MNLILLKKSDFLSSDSVILKNRRYEHLVRVNKARENDTFRCGVINGKMGTCVISKKSDDFIEMKIVNLDQDPPDALEMTLILALPRPKVLRRIIETVTSLGVKRIYLINSWRVEKSFWQTPVLDSMDQAMILGLEQSRDTKMPTIIKKRLFSGFVNQELPKLSRNTEKIVAHPTASKACPCDIKKPVTLVVGPEGGFIQREIETFEKYGFQICQIGARVLKVETAVTSLISRLYI